MDEIAALKLQVRRLQAEGRVRDCVARYPAPCDTLDADAPLDERAGRCSAFFRTAGLFSRPTGPCNGSARLPAPLQHS